MERIRQAVEQARRDRQKSGLSDEPRGALVARKSSGDVSARAERDSSEPISYDQTQTVEISADTKDRNRLVAAIHGHPLQDVYRMLRTRILQDMRANNWKVIAVTSPAVGTGKTLTAINLAISIARDLSHTAILIDGDLRHPSVHKYFDYNPKYGLNDYVLNNIPIEQALFHPNLDRLTVLPGREPMAQSAEMLASPKIISMLREIRSRYTDRIVIVDIAPVLSVDDALALAPNVDCMLIVAEAGQTSRDDLGRALELLDGIPIIGTVLNKVKKKVNSTY